MSNIKFTLICEKCNTKIKIKNKITLEKILINKTTDLNSNIIITCQKCGNFVRIN